MLSKNCINRFLFWLLYKTEKCAIGIFYNIFNS